MQIYCQNSGIIAAVILMHIYALMESSLSFKCMIYYFRTCFLMLLPIAAILRQHILANPRWFVQSDRWQQLHVLEKLFEHAYMYHMHVTWCPWTFRATEYWFYVPAAYKMPLPHPLPPPPPSHPHTHSRTGKLRCMDVFWSLLESSKKKQWLWFAVDTLQTKYSVVRVDRRI